MKVLEATLAFGAIAVGLVSATNNDKVVLVHGLGGWGESEFFGFPYWSYKPEIEQAGLSTIVAAMGKFTSNWDRACELYAQLKGTKVDYGVCHSSKHGHARFGKDYSGIGKYPEWDASHPVHLVGHSMGGQTMRELEYLLRQGSGCAQDTSPLFTGGHKWITSITSISGTVDGTTFVDQMGTGLQDFLKDLIVSLAGILDSTLIDTVYDLDFSQWGLYRNSGESFDAYWDRVEASGILNNEDISLYDMAPAGARKKNNRNVVAYPDTYYFSVATERTNYVKDCFLIFWCTEYEEPDFWMTIFLQLSASIIGDESNEKALRKNDGLVNWQSQICPTNDASGKSNCKPYSGTWTPGVWYYQDANQLDHIQVILRNTLADIFDFDDSAKKLYLQIGQRLKALPSGAALAKGGEVPAIVANEQVENDNADLMYMTQTKKVVASEKFHKQGVVAITVVGFVAMISLISFLFLARRKFNEFTEEKIEKEIERRSSVNMSHYVSEFNEQENAEKKMKKRSSLISSLRNSLRVNSLVESGISGSVVDVEDQEDYRKSIRQSVSMPPKEDL